MAIQQQATVAPGFADAVHDSQGLFAALMDAMARPGRIKPCDGIAGVPDPLNPVAAAVLLTLTDYDTPLWLDEYSVGHPDLAAWIGLHCGAPVTDRPADARFALITRVEDLAPISRFNSGDDTYPDRSATLIVQLDALNDGNRWQLTGPGIEREHSFQVAPAMPGFTAEWEINRASFPRGVDMIFCAPDSLACLPRTTHIEEV